MASSSTSQYGFYGVEGAAGRSLAYLYESPLGSRLDVVPFLLPSGGVPLPSGSSFQQSTRPAVTHRLLVQSPVVYPNAPGVTLIVQCYDAFGNARVASPAVRLSLTMGALSMDEFSMSTSGNTRVFTATLPRDWFEATSASRATAEVTSQVNGLHSQRSSLEVVGDPEWFGFSLSRPGIFVYTTSDSAGSTPAETMRVGEPFYLQFYAHTGGAALSSFEVRLVHNSDVCTPVLESGASFTSSFTGELRGEMDGTYATELLKRQQDPDNAGSYFIKYSRFERTPTLTSNRGGLGYVEMRMVAPGICLTSATVTAFYKDGGTSMISGVGVGDNVVDAVANAGHRLSLIQDGLVGVVGEVAEGMPIVNTGYLSGNTLDATLVTKAFLSGSDLDLDTSTSAVPIGLDDDGSYTQGVSAGAFASQVNVTVVRPPIPALSVDDDQLNSLSACGSFQTTRLRATAGGLDVARLLSVQTTDATVATIDNTGPYPVVVAQSVGAARLYVRSPSFSAVNVTVSATPVAVSRLSASIVTSASWRGSSDPSGPFAATTYHSFVSEGSVGWLYVSATFEDGATRPVDAALTALVPSPMNQSVAVESDRAGAPPEIRIRLGALSLCGTFEVTSCLGSATAAIHVTLPSPTRLVLTSSSPTLSPAANVGAAISSYPSSAQLTATVHFDDGSSRPMQADPRVSFRVSDGCGSVNEQGVLSLAEACRTDSVSLEATAVLGEGAENTVSGSLSVSAVWLASVEVRLYYRQDRNVRHVSETLRYRYDCAATVAPTFHRLAVKTFGTLTNGEVAQIPLSSLSHSVGGTSSGAAVNSGWLDVRTAGHLSRAHPLTLTLIHGLSHSRLAHLRRACTRARAW